MTPTRRPMSLFKLDNSANCRFPAPSIDGMGVRAAKIIPLGDASISIRIEVFLVSCSSTYTSSHETVKALQRLICLMPELERIPRDAYHTRIHSTRKLEPRRSMSISEFGAQEKREIQTWMNSNNKEFPWRAPRVLE